MTIEWVETKYCRLALGDCRELLPTLAAGSVDAVVTSPPYNLKKKWWDSGSNGIHVELASKFKNEWYDDELPEDIYQRQQVEILNQCRRVCSGAICYNHKIRHAFKRAGRTFHPIEWTGAADLWCEIIWDRGPGPAVNCRRPTMADERIFVFGKPKVWNDFGQTSIWKIRANAEDVGHPCAFPMELPSRLILSFTEEGMTVADWFMGSGTTAIACIRTGRKFIGCEIDPKYFQIALKRIREEEAKPDLFAALKEEPKALAGDLFASLKEST